MLFVEGIFIFRRMHSALIALTGSWLLAGGAVLALLGGSWGYLPLGAGLFAVGFARWRGRPSAVTLYGWVFLGNALWSVVEAGWDGWALLPRLGWLGFLGLPFLWNGRRPSEGLRTRWRMVLLAALATCAVAIVSSRFHIVDPVERVGWGAPAETTIPESGDEGWSVYGHDAGGSRHSAARGLTVANAGQLQEAWRYTVDESDAALEATPIAVGDVVYLCSGTNDVIALSAPTGRELWRYRSQVDASHAVLKACRGVAYVQVASGAAPCAQRVLTNTVDARLIALDALTGAPCEGFGDHGIVSLRNGMGDWAGRSVPGYYYVTSAPTIVGDRVILGGWVSDAQYWGEPSGVIRAYDVTTGQFVWAFDMGRPGEHGEPASGEHYTPSTPNSWAPMAADPQLGLVYAPTGNTSGSDYYGVRRRAFDEHYSSSVVALDARTGEPRWSFQTVHHDLWDYDVAPQPVLVDLQLGGATLPALLQATKTGEIFVLDRRDGQPLKPVHEVPVSTRSVVPGERVSATQPVSVGMPGFAGPPLTEAQMWGLTPFDQLACRIGFRRARYDGAFTPPDTQSFIEYPGILGGIEWSSVSVDPTRGLLFVDASRMANLARLIPREEAEQMGRRPEGFGGRYMHRAQEGTPYAVANPFFVSPIGVPCQQPPYGTLSAVDLQSGRLIWHQRLGSARDSGPWGLRLGLPLPLGTPHLGGTFNTATGVLATAAGQDQRLRLFNAVTGEALASYPLPAVSVATPMTFAASDHRQYVVVVAGNQDPRLGATGHTVIAFRTPSYSTTEGQMP